MPKIQSINFPDDLHRDLMRRVKDTPGGKFSPYVVHLIERGLLNTGDQGNKASESNIQKSQSATG
jgi:hypothetical protein